MIKLVQITDLHLLPSGGLLRDVLDPEPRLRECLEDIEALHGDAAALIITGDLTENGDLESYWLLKRILAGYRLPPVHLTIGNHDERRRFGQVFPEAVDAETGFAQTSFDLGDHVGILLDTWTDGSHVGSLCNARLAWLAETLSRDTRPALLFLHHAPFQVGLKWLDRHILEDGIEFAEAIAPFRNRIKHMFFGHMHRSVSGTWGGMPFTVVPSTALNGLLDFDSDLSCPTVMEPHYSVTLLRDDNVIVHPKQVSKSWIVIEPIAAKMPTHAL